MPRPLRVFLCHASQDKPVVWKLHRYLKQHGVKPWLDQDELLPGQTWEVEIPKALFASDVILVCLSKNSVNKEGYVQKEIVFALDKALEKPEGTIFIVPVKLEECDVPKRLSPYQWVDYYRPEGRKRLLLGLNKRVAELGDDVLPVNIEETRQRKPAPKPVNFDQIDRDSLERVVERVDQEIIEKALREKTELDILDGEAKEKSKRESEEETIREKLEQEVHKQETSVAEKKKEQIKKPFTKVLDPSALAPKTVKDSPGVKKSVPSNNVRSLAIGGLIFIALFFIIFGRNYIAKDVPSVKKASVVPLSVTLQAPTLTATSAATPQPPTPTKMKIMSTFTITPVPPTLTSSPIPLPIGSTMVSDKDGMVMVYVPAGEFTMGSDDDSAVSNPEHLVYLDAYWIDQTEVTNAMFATFLNEKGNQSVFRAEWLDALDSDDISQDGNQWIVKNGYKNRPVVQVTWYGAFAYCSWAERKLPTEEQWEKAARGIDARIYPWGNETPNASLLNFNSNIGDTNKVGSYWQGVSPYGAYDMSGNVWEWVNAEFETQVLRGGSFSDSEDLVRSYVRESSGPEFSQDHWGFRCSRSP